MLSFDAAAELDLQLTAFAVIAADINGDDRPDLIVTHREHGSVSVLENLGGGVLAAPVTYPIGGVAWWAAAGDLTGNGDPDLAVTDTADHQIVLLRNVGGVLEPWQTLPTALSPRVVMIADLNGDGHADLVVVNRSAGSISVFPNNGDGTFTAPVHYGVGHNPESLTVADLDGDGHPDLAVANTGAGTVTILTNDGDGGFTASATYAVGGGPLSIVAADLDNDGHVDLAVANAASEDVAVLWNDGSGGFLGPFTWESGPLLSTLAAGDLDGDGYLDLVATSREADVLAVLHNSRDRGFLPVLHLPVGEHPIGVTMADLSDSGRHDLVAANRDSDSLSILMNTSLPPYSQDCNSNGIPDECDIASGFSQDVNGNGIPDECETSFTIGGAVYTELSDPIGSALADVEVVVQGAGGSFTASTNAFGVWQVNDVPEGSYTVTPSLACHQFEHVVGGSVVGTPPVTIEVNLGNQAANQSIQFLVGPDPDLLLHDMNWDGFVSIVGDVEPFVRVVYFGEYDWYEQQFPGRDPVCPGDCNGDGFLSIIGDVPCFVDCVFFGQCPGPESTVSPAGQAIASLPEPTETYTIGGAVYADLETPLTSGVAGVEVIVTGDNGTFNATTASSQGLWMIQNVPAGDYTVTATQTGKCFGHVSGGSVQGTSAAITVDGDSQASNQSIQFLANAPATADLDGDCDVDADDFAIFAACMTGPAILYNPAALPPGCNLIPDQDGFIAADFNRDGSVDQTDFAVLQRCFSGENIPADPACAE